MSLENSDKEKSTAGISRAKNKLFFNVAGICLPNEHYMLDPYRGILDEIMLLIERRLFFVIHAARQTGKTTLLQALTDKINSEGEYYAVYCSLETLKLTIDAKEGIPAIVRKLKTSINRAKLPEGFASNADYDDFGYVLNDTLSDYCEILDKPLVIFFDEADCLSEGTLINFLGQIRDGYNNRSRTPFPQCITLIGVRNIRDYKAFVRPESQSTGVYSPFNVITKSLNLRYFTKPEVIELYNQHTSAKGQVFETDMIDYVFEQTQGQPYLVNAIARECVEEICKQDYTIPITKAMAEQAIQNLIKTRVVHLDSILDKLKESKVRKVIVPLITGEDFIDRTTEEYQYTRDLGLIRDDRGIVEPGNPIYAELIIRTLNWDAQNNIQSSRPDDKLPRYIKDGKIDMTFLLNEFQVFWRENSDIWKARFAESYYKYDEAAAQLVLQAFLQRVINSDGTIIREMVAGTGRADMCIVYKDQKYPIEMKIKQNLRNMERCLAQIAGYMDKLGADTGWMVVFDKDTERSWDEKIYTHYEIVDGKNIIVMGC